MCLQMQLFLRSPSMVVKILPLAFCCIFATLFSEEASSNACSGSSSKSQVSPFEKECYQYPAAYNAPAAVAFHQSWSYFFDSSFLYWYAREEGLHLAESAILVQGNLALTQEAVSLDQSFEYRPGFKIGIGVIYNNEWSIHGEYTWLRNHTTINKEAPENTSSDLTGLGIWNMNDWFQQTIAFQEVNSLQGQSLSGTALASSWRLGVDIVDLDASRPYFEGSNLTLFPFIGLRAAWIRQTIEVALTQAPGSVGGASFLLPQPIHSHNNSNCWGIGPRIGFNAKCLLPQGWRLEGSGAGSLLATFFTTLTHAEDAQSIAVAPGPYKVVQSHQKSLLPNAELGLGFGWEMYNSPRSYHIDFSASYDFTIFWGQNKIREMLDNFWAGTDAEAGNLFFHGLTLYGRFDF